MTIPAPGATAFHLAPVADGCYLWNDTVELPDTVFAEDWLTVQFEMYVEGALDAGCAVLAELNWYEVGEEAPFYYDDLVNAACWYPSPPRPDLKDTWLPLDGFARITAHVQVPPSALGITWGYSLFLAVTDPTWGTGADAAEMWLTNIAVNLGPEAGKVAPFAYGRATLSGPPAEFVGLVAGGALGIDAEVEAWLSHAARGRDSLQAFGAIHTGSYAYLGIAGVAAPAHPDITPPTVAVPDIRSLRVRAGGYPLRRAEISDLTIDLDVEGGPKAATLTVASDMRRAPALLTTLVVVYKGRTLFRGRLEAVSGTVDSASGYTLIYAGPLVRMRDHKAFRKVYVDSDLQSWQTDQGPRSSPDTFEVMSKA